MSECPDNENENNGLYGWSVYLLVGAYIYSFHVTDKLSNRMTYVLIAWVATYIIAEMIIEGYFKMLVVELGKRLPNKFRLRYAVIAVLACFLIEFCFPFSSFSEEVRPIPEEEKFAIECLVEASEGALSEDFAFYIIHEMNLMKMKKEQEKSWFYHLNDHFYDNYYDNYYE